VISYKKLWMLLIEKDITKQQLAKDAEFSLATLTKLNKNEYVAMSVIEKICTSLKCDVGDIMEVVSENEE